jgi:phosphatidylglycerophosphate synthase
MLGQVCSFTTFSVTTVFRICATPVIGYLVVEEMYTPACGLFVLAGLTDMVIVMQAEPA